MTTVSFSNHKICRICSCPAYYEIYAKIPTYLHAKSNEFLNSNWQKPINTLLEDVTGLKVTKDDALPSTICALCISYLKHAVTFREQVINNTMALKVAQLLSAPPSSSAPQPQRMDGTNENNDSTLLVDVDKASELITAQELMWDAAEERQLNVNQQLNTLLQDQNKVNKLLLNNNRHTQRRQSTQNMADHMRYLNLLFDKDINTGLTPQKRKKKQLHNDNIVGATNYSRITFDDSTNGVDGDEEFPTTTSSDDEEDEVDDEDDDDDDDEGQEDDSDETKQKHCNIFSYHERNFEEDDIMDYAELRNVIEINRPPDNFKERKCRACSRRFMFEASFKEHMNTCIELMLLMFIEEVNQLLQIRRGKAQSPHEFIRRMIFALRKTGEWLKANCEDETLLLDITSATTSSTRNPLAVINNNNNEIQEPVQSKPEEQQQRFISDEKVETADYERKPMSPIASSMTPTVNERLAQLIASHQKREKTKKSPTADSNEAAAAAKVVSINGVCNNNVSNARRQTTTMRTNSPFNPIAKELSLDDDDDDDAYITSIRRKNDVASTLFATPKTSILKTENILYEIERAQSRNSIHCPQRSEPPLAAEQASNTPISDIDLNLDIALPLPQLYENPNIASGNIILAAEATTTTTTTTTTINGTKMEKSVFNLPDVERLTFLQKLQRAACPKTPPPTSLTNSTIATPRTPFIQVRKDLMESTTMNTVSTPMRSRTTSLTPTSAKQAETMTATLVANNIRTSPLLQTPPVKANKFSARCNPCNLLFETLVALEMHNALMHNHSKNYVAIASEACKQSLDLEMERKKIIALFEDDDDV